MDSLSQVPQKCLAIWDLLLVLGPTSKGEVIDGAIQWVTLHRASNDVQFSVRQLHMQDILHNGDGEGVTVGREAT